MHARRVTIAIAFKFRAKLPFNSFAFRFRANPCGFRSFSAGVIVVYQLATFERSKMVFDDYTKQRILFFFFQGSRAPAIARHLETEGIIVSRRGVAKFVKRYLTTGTIARRQGSGRKTKITDDIKRIVDEKMALDDETTATQLHVLLTSLGYSLSLRTILRCRTVLGWTFRGSAYCQLIREPNKRKRLEWALKNKDEDFSDVIFTDESTIQQESHRRFCCRKIGQPPKSKPR